MMKAFQITVIRKLLPTCEGGIRARVSSQGRLASVLVALVGCGWAAGVSQAQEENNEVKGAEVLTRGPVHEAFAGTINYNPAPGIVVTKAPPEAIVEIPPGERPEGTNITWIPGYWTWDDERSDFLWVSGTWRALPPGRAWLAGYWGEAADGYQWTSGYWANASTGETTYLPAPPATLESGPSTKAPSRDYGWTPGSWMWQEQRYAWSPGYWVQGRANWNWIPSHYVWTRRGYIYVDGYWDYPVQRRGMLFAPVYFNSGLYSQAGYHYSPSIALDLVLFAEYLFLRPNYHHYYFGDYYDRSYNQHGYYAAYAYQNNRSGYDPIYSHQRWEHRQDRGWNQQMVSSYQNRVDNVSARPPRTWAAMRTQDAGAANTRNQPMKLAAPLDQMVRSKKGSVKFQTVAKQDQQMLAKRGLEVQQTREARRKLEATGGNTSTGKAGELAPAAKVQLPKSTIVGQSASQFKKNQAPPPALRNPKTVKADSTRTESSGHPPKGDQVNPQQEPRKNGVTPRNKTVQPDSGKTSAVPHPNQDQPDVRKSKVTPRNKTVTPEPRKNEATPREQKSQPEPRKTQDAPREQKSQPEPRKTQATPREQKSQPEPRKSQDAPRERQSQPERTSKGTEDKNPRTTEQPTKSKSSSNDNGDEKSDKKGHKKGSAPN